MMCSPKGVAIRVGPPRDAPMEAKVRQVCFCATGLAGAKLGCLWARSRPVRMGRDRRHISECDLEVMANQCYTQVMMEAQKERDRRTDVAEARCRRAREVAKNAVADEKAAEAEARRVRRARDEFELVFGPVEERTEGCRTVVGVLRERPVESWTRRNNHDAEFTLNSLQTLNKTV